MAAASPFYIIDGWLRVPQAAKLLHVKSARVREWMGDGTLEWCQLRMNSTTLLVDEHAVMLLCQERQTELKAAARRARSNLPTARQRRTSQLDVPPPAATRSSDIFVRTWDPSPGPEGLARGRRKAPGEPSS